MFSHRLTDKPLKLTVVDEAGESHTAYMRRHYNADQPHISEDFVKLEQAHPGTAVQHKTQNWAMQSVYCATLRGFSG